MATGLGYGVRFSVLENSQHRWVKKKAKLQTENAEKTQYFVCCANLLNEKLLLLSD
jgi:hypothetical protein